MKEAVELSLNFDLSCSDIKDQEFAMTVLEFQSYLMFSSLKLLIQTYTSSFEPLCTGSIFEHHKKREDCTT